MDLTCKHGKPLAVHTARARQAGVTAIEYALLAGVIALAVISGAGSMGSGLSDTFGKVGAVLASAAGGGSPGAGDSGGSSGGGSSGGGNPGGGNPGGGNPGGGNPGGGNPGGGNPGGGNPGGGNPGGGNPGRGNSR